MRQALWDDVTMLSANDLSNDDHTIIYGSFKVTQTGAGSILYKTAIPATNWDRNVTPICTGCTTPVWNPTVNLAARNNCSMTYGPILNDIYAYPFISNPNFDFERGLPISTITLNDNGNKISETDYTYQQYQPAIMASITGFRYDKNTTTTPSLTNYNKYLIYYNSAELTSAVTKTLWDAQAQTTSTTSTVVYTYGSLNHEQPTLITTQNSDLSTLTTHISYVKDYTIPASSTNTKINALYNLQQLNVNAPVETYQQIVRGGAAAVTTNAALTIFDTFNVNGQTLYLPSEQLKMITKDGGSFASLLVNTSVPSITWDSKYYPTGNIENYDETGFPIVVDDANHHTQTVIKDQNTGMPVAAFDGVNYKRVAMNDFDSNLPALAKTFNISGTGFVPNGSHTRNAYGLNTTQTVTSSSLTNGSTTQNIVFSIWINAVTAGTLTLTVTGVTSNPTISYKSGGWAYYQKVIPAASVPSAYTASFTANTPISIDDIFIYPQQSTLSTMAYDPVTLYKTAQTNTNGVSTYVANDPIGRPLYIYDQDKNVVARNTYITNSQIQSGISAAFRAESPEPNRTTYIKNQTITYTNNGYPTGMTYYWDFGDGNTIVGADKSIVTHTYTSANTYNATLKVTHPVFGTDTYTVPITVLDKPPALVVDICSYGVSSWNNCNNTANSTNSCNGNTGSPDRTFFMIFAVYYGTYAPLHYQWQKSIGNSNVWRNVGSDATTYFTDSYVGVRQTLTHYRCIVSSAVQDSGTSNSVLVDVTNCP